MPAMVTRDLGGLRLSKMPSFATIADRLAEKRRFRHHGIGKSIVDFDRQSTLLTYLVLMLGCARMGALDQKGRCWGVVAQIKAEITVIQRTIFLGNQMCIRDRCYTYLIPKKSGGLESL